MASYVEFHELTEDEADQLCQDCSEITNNLCVVKRIAIDISSSNLTGNDNDLIMLFLDPLKTDDALSEMFPNLSLNMIRSGRVEISKCEALPLVSNLAQLLMDRPISVEFPKLTFRKPIEDMIRLALYGVDRQLELINFRPLLEHGQLNWESPMLKNLSILHNLNHNGDFILPQLPHVDTDLKQSFFTMNLSNGEHVRSTVILDFTIMKSKGEHTSVDLYSLPEFQTQHLSLRNSHEFNKVLSRYIILITRYHFCCVFVIHNFSCLIVYIFQIIFNRLQLVLQWLKPCRWPLLYLMSHQLF